MLPALNCACLGALQYWLGYVCNCEASMRKSMCYCFFTRTKQPHTFHTICSNPCATATFKAGSQQLLAIRMANTGTSTVDGDTKQPLGPVDLHCVCSYTCARQENQSGNSLTTNLIGMASKLLTESFFKHMQKVTENSTCTLLVQM